MSGGIAYVWDRTGDFPSRCNREMVGLEALEPEDEEFVKGILARHRDLTGSPVAGRLLEEWAAESRRIVKVMPFDYKKAIEALKTADVKSTETAMA